MMDVQSRAFREASEADWQTAGNLVGTLDTGPFLSPEEWWSIGWDAGRVDPYTPAQARAALHERIHDPAAPDTIDDATAYDDIVADEDEVGRHGAGVRPLTAGAVRASFLPDAVKSAGLPCVLVPGWEARGHGSFRQLEIVVGHHTGTPQTAKGDYPSQNIVTVGRSDLAGPLCNVGLARSGAVIVVAAGVAWHAGASKFAGYTDLNSVSLGIEAESAGGGLWTPAQMDAYPRLVAALLRYINRPADRYCSHRTCATPAGRKPDPTGIADQWMRDQVVALAAKPAAPKPTPATPVTQTKGRDIMIGNTPLDGSGSDAFGIPVGSASAITKRGWIAFISKGPTPGVVSVWFQRGDGTGIDDHQKVAVPFDPKTNRGGAVGWELPDGTWRVNVSWDFPDGGTMVIEAEAK